MGPDHSPHRGQKTVANPRIPVSLLELGLITMYAEFHGPVPLFQPVPGANPVVCNCFGITEAEIKHLIQLIQAGSVKEVMAHTDAGSACRACHCRIQRLVEGKPAYCTGLCPGQAGRHEIES